MYLTIGVVIIAVLGCVAIHLQMKVRKQERRRKEVELQQKKKLIERREFAQKSIKILAKATLEDQLTLTETSMRIAAMIQIFPLSEQQQAQHRCFVELAKATAHIPILEEWKKLPKAKKREFDVEREKHEKEYKEFVLDACQSITDDEQYLVEYFH